MENSPSLYARAREAAQRGKNTQAKDLLYEVVLCEPDNLKAWLLLSKVAGDKEEKDV